VRALARRSVAAWVVLAVVALATLAVGTVTGDDAATPADRVLALSRSIRCPQCSGQSVAESDVTVSREIRRDIARRVEEGQTDDEIRAYYASSFGEEALLTPSSEGLGGLVWALPVIVVVVGAAGIVLALRRWSAAGAVEATDDDRELVARALATSADDGGAEPGIGDAVEGDDDGGR
jgi:cytochrome c-type biogenesis protein CcmH